MFVGDPLNSSGKSPFRKIDFARSGLVTTIILAILFAGLTFLFKERGKGHLHKLTTPTPLQKVEPSPQPGGKDPISIARLSMVNGSTAEFLSTTVLPGLGMSILDLKAELPMRGEIQLLQGSTVKEITAAADKYAADKAATPETTTHVFSTMSSPMLAWSSHSSVDQDDLQSSAIFQSANSNDSHGMPDGGDATALFTSLSKPVAGSLPPGIELRSSILMSGRAMEINLTARNVGNSTLPLRLGWLPHFILPGDDRSEMRIVVPATQRIASGNTVEVTGFNTGDGKAIGDSMDVTLTHLTRDFLSAGSEIRLLDPQCGCGIRVTTLSPNIRTVRILAPAGAPWVAIVPIADATETLANRVASASGGQPTKGLAPGAIMHWKIRVELMELMK